MMYSAPGAPDANPLRELVIWLLFIWTPVLCLYVISHQPISPTIRPIHVGPQSETERVRPPNRVGETSENEQLKNMKETAEIPTLQPKVPPQINTRTDTNSVRDPILREPLKGAKEDQLPLREESREELPGEDVPEDSSKLDKLEHGDDVSTQNLASQPAIPAKKQYSSPTSPYLAMVQRRISREWQAPSTTQPTEAVIGFRLDRSGQIKDVYVEQSSGDEYFDLAAQRAVVAANPLPPFYPDVTDDYLNTHLRFANE